MPPESSSPFQKETVREVEYRGSPGKCSPSGRGLQVSPSYEFIPPSLEKEGGYTGMVRWMADHECAPNAGQALCRGFPRSGTRPFGHPPPSDLHVTIAARLREGSESSDIRQFSDGAAEAPVPRDDAAAWPHRKVHVAVRRFRRQ